MKRLIFLIACCQLFVFHGIAQKSSYEFLKSEKQLNIVMDYSIVKIDGYTEPEFIEYQCIRGGEKWKTKWDSIIKKDLYQKFTGYFNENFIGKSELRGGNFPDAGYVATVKLVKIDFYGTTEAKVIITKKGSDTVINIIDIVGRGGKAGSRENLMGDGFKRAGSDLGKKMLKNLGILNI
jgi:hypothetical protein